MAVAVCAVVVSGVLAGCTVPTASSTTARRPPASARHHPGPTRTAGPGRPKQHAHHRRRTPKPARAAEPARAALTAGGAMTVLDELAVKGRAPMTGYSRDRFGSAWTDDNTDLWGHNGCDTRNDILRRDLTRQVIESGTGGCVVLTGVLHAPYTGRRIAFTRGVDTSTAVEIDHVVSVLRTVLRCVVRGHAVSDIPPTA